MDFPSFIHTLQSAARRFLLPHPPLPLPRPPPLLLPQNRELEEDRLPPRQSAGGGNATRKSRLRQKQPKRLPRFRIFPLLKRIYQATIRRSAGWAWKRQIRHSPTFRIQGYHWKMRMHFPLPNWIIPRNPDDPKASTAIPTFPILENRSTAHRRHRTNGVPDCGATNRPAVAPKIVAAD